jgi:SNF2 family DNA or RNA helicase
MAKILKGVSVIQFHYPKLVSSKCQTTGNPGSVKVSVTSLMQLRKICQHPFLFESVEDKISPAGFIDDKLVRTSGKIELLHRMSSQILCYKSQSKFSRILSEHIY